MIHSIRGNCQFNCLFANAELTYSWSDQAIPTLDCATHSLIGIAFPCFVYFVSMTSLYSDWWTKARSKVYFTIFLWLFRVNKIKISCGYLCIMCCGKHMRHKSRIISYNMCVTKKGEPLISKSKVRNIYKRQSFMVTAHWACLGNSAARYAHCLTCVGVFITNNLSSYILYIISSYIIVLKFILGWRLPQDVPICC